jgi:hypothetical protein
LSWTVALVLAAFLLGIGAIALRVARQARIAAQAADALQALEATARGLERQEQQVKLVEDLLAVRRQTAVMLAELFRLAASEILFESVAFDRSRGEVVVRGSAPMTRQVLGYLGSLERSGHWERVELRSAARRSTSAGARTEFEMALYRGAS